MSKTRALQQEAYDAGFFAGYRAGRVDGVTAFLQQHAPNCTFHLDQYPWECTCKPSPKATAPSVASTEGPTPSPGSGDEAR